MRSILLLASAVTFGVAVWGCSGSGSGGGSGCSPATASITTTPAGGATFNETFPCVKGTVTGGSYRYIFSTSALLPGSSCPGTVDCFYVNVGAAGPGTIIVGTASGAIFSYGGPTGAGTTFSCVGSFPGGLASDGTITLTSLSAPFSGSFNIPKLCGAPGNTAGVFSSVSGSFSG